MLQRERFIVARPVRHSETRRHAARRYDHEFRPLPVAGRIPGRLDCSDRAGDVELARHKGAPDDPDVAAWRQTSSWFRYAKPAAASADRPES